MQSFVSLIRVFLSPPMTEPQEVRLFHLPDDMLTAISEYCDLTTRCAVTCTNSTALSSVLLGRVALSMEASERFLKDTRFRLRMSRRVVKPDRNIHLQVHIKEIMEDPHIVILNSVRSVFLFTETKWNSAWGNQLSRIQTLTKLDLRDTMFSDVSALAGLTNLTHLYLGNLQVSDMSALAGLVLLHPPPCRGRARSASSDSNTDSSSFA